MGTDGEESGKNIIEFILGCKESNLIAAWLPEAGFKWPGWPWTVGVLTSGRNALINLGCIWKPNRVLLKPYRIDYFRIWDDLSIGFLKDPCWFHCITSGWEPYHKSFCKFWWKRAVFKSYDPVIIVLQDCTQHFPFLPVDLKSNLNFSQMTLPDHVTLTILTLDGLYTWIFI